MISIIIPTYNHCNDFLKPCIESIIKYTYLEDVEIIVSANGCTDNTKEYVESLGEPFKLVWNTKSIGFSKSMNEGIKISSGEYIILLNNDTVLLHQNKNNWINILKTPFLKNNKIGITGPLMGCNKDIDRHFLIFFCVMIKKEVFNTIGLLDESFGVGAGEDTDFCIKAEQAGFQLVQTPSEKLDYDPRFMKGCFPLYHKGEGTVHDPNCVTNWTNIFHRNSKELFKRYGSDNEK
jgi:GT2 family glycosyltransferase